MFVLQAIGIGVQTMGAAYKIKNGFGNSNSNVIEFDKNSYWENQFQKFRLKTP